MDLSLKENLLYLRYSLQSGSERQRSERLIIVHKMEKECNPQQINVI